VPSTVTQYPLSTAPEGNQTLWQIIKKRAGNPLTKFAICRSCLFLLWNLAHNFSSNLWHHYYSQRQNLGVFFNQSWLQRWSLHKKQVTCLWTQDSNCGLILLGNWGWCRTKAFWLVGPICFHIWTKDTMSSDYSSLKSPLFWGDYNINITICG
jgi:hypothetical protein